MPPASGREPRAFWGEGAMLGEVVAHVEALKDGFYMLLPGPSCLGVLSGGPN